MLICVVLQVLISILANGEKQRDMATMVEGNLGDIEEDLIQVRSYVIINALRNYRVAAHLCFQVIGIGFLYGITGCFFKNKIGRAHV